MTPKQQLNMHPLLEFLFVLLKMGYYYLEAIYRVFIPVERKDIKGQNVLVTGGGQGIGRAIAVKFSAADANIILWDINASGLKETADDLRIRGAKVHTYVCDVTNREAVIETAAKVKKDVGKVDILVNNAGVLIGKDIMSLTEKDIRKTYEVNTICHFWTVQAFLPSMLERNHGHIITIASMAGRSGTPLLTDYCASKFAAYGFTESLMMELRAKNPNTQIHTTTVCPMFVNTNLIFGEDVVQRVQYNDRFGKLLQPEDVAEAVVDGTLRNKTHVYVPSNGISMDYIQAVLPMKARLAFFDFLDVSFYQVNK